MPKRRFGELLPRYSFILNPYEHERLSRCPQCRRPTHNRKFALCIHVEEFGLITLGKTCRYCTPCELIIAHRHELEAEIAHNFESLAPEVIGNDYLVLGTLDKKVWQKSVRGEELLLHEAAEHIAQFKRYLDLVVTPGGWGPA